MLKFWSDYRPVEDHTKPEDDQDESSAHPQDDYALRPKQHIIRTGLLLLSKMIVVFLATYGSWELISKTPLALPPHKQNNVCWCGFTVAEALSNGCEYDLLASAWLPKHCQDVALTAEFNRSGPGPNGEWGYWLDENGTLPMVPGDVGLVADSDTIYWTTSTWHVVHCLFYWRKQFRSRSNGIVVEARYDNEKHIRHCTRIVLEALKSPVLNTTQQAALESGE